MSDEENDQALRGPERRLPFNAPVRAWSLSEWALVPLRAFIGATFLYAGMQKLANPNFFKKTSPISIQSQLIAASHTSPIHAILSHLEGIAKPIGLVIAFSEIAIGLGTLVGLWTRVAALGGLVLSLSLFLTVSFHASPYFTGADIVFFFAWMPFIIAGGGTRLSLDAWIQKRVARKAGQPSPELVAIPFSTVQAICGNYVAGACAARGGLACDAAVCPVLIGGRAPLAIRTSLDAIDRRSLIVGATAAASAAAAVLIVGGAAADTGSLIGDAPAPKSTTPVTLSPSATTTTTTPGSVTTTTAPGSVTTTTTPVAAPKGKLLGSVASLPDNSSAAFTIPSNGEPGLVVHTATGDFVAYNAVCPHMGCTVGYSSANKIIICPCHGSEFEVSNGHVIVGPAPHGLTKLKVEEGTNGNLYLQ
ncbi:MAG TPA: Rieske 2Fe-2S domain-containing protein [Acidimicrobiales bacterium]|nr:Rieske 2Fe-2S domain-containing protein [Acidimicrobiales bacterium]